MIKRRHQNSQNARKARTVPSHEQWIRGFCCIIDDDLCQGKVQCCHVRSGTDGGGSFKPHSRWTVPMCVAHHQLQHDIGEPAFERRYGIDLKKEAEKLAAASPHLKRLEKTE